MNVTRIVPLGECVATQRVLDAVPLAEIHTLITRHRTCDWGDVEAEDQAANDFALANGERLLSSYITSDGVHVWIITEADRSATTLLLPSEY